MEESLLGKLAAALRGMGGAVQDPQFRSDVVGRLADALRGGVADVFPTGAGPIVSRNMGVPADPNYRNKMTDLGLAGLTVYHGSPYKFDKFDMSKVGTGEGAQAYGHGLYFAEAPDVAQAYKQRLSTQNSLLSPKIVTFKDGSTAEVGTSGWALNMLKKGNMDIAETRNAIQTELNDAIRFNNQLAISNAKNALKALDDGAFDISGINTGSLYRVDLPDDQIAKMLDWDRPLTATPNARAALDGLIPKLDKDSAKLLKQDADRLDGSGLVTWAQRVYGKDGASAYLQSHGIPGIKYLDQGSRGAGKGTSNFVVFSDDLPKILGRE